MHSIKVNVSLYGSLARIRGSKHIAQFDVELPPGARKSELLAHLNIPEEEKGYVFINAVLCDVPGLTTDRRDFLQDGDHIGIFSVDRVWPYQYRDGVRMSEELKQALQKYGAMHHSYKHVEND